MDQTISSIRADLLRRKRADIATGVAADAETLVARKEHVFDEASSFDEGLAMYGREIRKDFSGFILRRNNWTTDFKGDRVWNGYPPLVNVIELRMNRKELAALKRREAKHSAEAAKSKHSAAETATQWRQVRDIS